MKGLIFVALGLLLLVPAGTALGQAGTIMLYSDPAYTSCNAVTVGAGFVFVYVVHNFVPAKSSRFMLENRGHNLVWFMDQFPPGSSNSAPGGGNTQVGWAVDYGGCQQPPHRISTVWYQDTGTPNPPCGAIWVVPDPLQPDGRVTGSNCNDELTFPGVAILTINEDGTCVCGET